MKTTKLISNVLMLTLFASFANAGGLDDATTAVNTIKVWAYGFLGAVCFVYLIYNVIMALAEKKQWGDVLMALGKVAVAGAVIVLGEWAWSIWGS
jgi:Kef-type K+ transport system membrane component KefB